ncbi:uncharacterized protein [Primulina huaijiensis]|uniref:uncharacterized protein n=1 Tax=Primulina huaijiensis TaxID=1492673 RepID=UPI003CC77D9B
MGQLRLDVDAAFRDQQNSFGVAGVLRNSDGNLILAFGRRIEKPLSVVHAELIALKMGLDQLRESGFSNVQVFSDSQMAVKAVMDPSLDFGYIGSCAQEIKNMVVEQRVLSLKHMRRSTNLVAHTLTQFVFSSPTPFCWVNGDFPS